MNADPHRVTGARQSTGTDLRALVCLWFAFDVFFAGWFLGYPGNAMADVLSYDRFALTPPPIYELTFSVRSGDHAPDFYFLRSQGSNYVVRSATSAARLRATVSQMGAEDICYGLCDGEFWSVRMFQFRPLYLRGKQATEGTNQLSFMVEALHRLCVVPLHLGLYDVDVPRAFWRGDTFHYASLSTKAQFEVRLHRDDRGWITSAEYSIGSDPMERLWFIDYEHDAGSGIPAGFPSAYFRSMNMGATPKRALNSTRILSLVIATNAMPADLFMPQQFLDVPAAHETLISNNLLYAKEGDSWEPVIIPSEGASGRGWFPSVSATILLIIAGIFAIIIGRRPSGGSNVASTKKG